MVLLLVCCLHCRQEPPSDTKEQPALTREQILSACDASLKRLQTDYIDLYQIHCENQGRLTHALFYVGNMSNIILVI